MISTLEVEKNIYSIMHIDRILKIIKYTQYLLITMMVINNPVLSLMSHIQGNKPIRRIAW